MTRLRKALFLSVAVLLMPPAASAGIILNPFAPSVYDTNTAAMDSALGISGYLIEDFEDLTLISGLSYTLESPDYGTFTSLPATLDGSTITGVDPDFYWDGTNILGNGIGNTVGQSFDGSRSDILTFNVAGGTSSFGVGLANFQSTNSVRFPITDHELLINGVSYDMNKRLIELL